MNILRKVRELKDELVKQAKTNIDEQRSLKREVKAAYKDEFRKAKVQAAKNKAQVDAGLKNNYQAAKKGFKKTSDEVEVREVDFRRGNVLPMDRR